MIQLGPDILIDEKDIYWVEKDKESLIIKIKFKSNPEDHYIIYDTEEERKEDFNKIMSLV